MKNYNAKDIGKFVNIGTGEDLTINALAEMIKNIVGFRGKIEWDEGKPNGTPMKLLDVRKIIYLGWKDRVPLSDGIVKAYNWFIK